MPREKRSGKTPRRSFDRMKCMAAPAVKRTVTDMTHTIHFGLEHCQIFSRWHFQRSTFSHFPLAFPKMTATAPANGTEAAPPTAQPAPPNPDGTLSTNHEQVITPWDVQGAQVDGKLVAIDYNKLIEQFGTRRIDEALFERLERLTGRKPHVFLRRGLFFSHRWVLGILV